MVNGIQLASSSWQYRSIEKAEILNLVRSCGVIAENSLREISNFEFSTKISYNACVMCAKRATHIDPTVCAYVYRLSTYHIPVHIRITAQLRVLLLISFLA